MPNSLKMLALGRSPMPLAAAARVAFGAAIGVAASGLAAEAIADMRLSWTPLLIAPIGASAVLVFALPASPVAQPRAVILGNTVAALVGCACALAIPNLAWAAACAVGAAILAMALLGCLHPPGGAIALGMALATAAGQPPGFLYALTPVALCSVLLVGAGMLFGRLTGHAYPHKAPATPSVHGTRDAPPVDRIGYRPADLDRALEQYGELLDVSREDLDALFRQVERQSQQRLHSRIFCEDVMSRDLISVDLHQSTDSALLYLQGHDLRTAPVLDPEGHVVGMVRRAELTAARGKRVESVLDPFVYKVGARTPIDALLPILSSGATHEAMVVDQERRLIGIITQTDLLAVLYRAHVVEGVVGTPAA